MNTHTACNQSREELQKLQGQPLKVEVKVNGEWKDSPTPVANLDEAMELGSRIYENWPDAQEFRIKRHNRPKPRNPR